MNKFFKKHPDFVLIFLTVTFLAILGTYFFWGVTTLVTKLNAAVEPDSEGVSAVKYDLEEAAQLNLKGLGPQK
ncbi:MAG: hypothetical protein Q8P49_00490 [Candidatus Liptonbacteria bacterium]|nr:hypothetical protein [Candidatus Liptonbacteria bacterium]